MGLKQVRNIIFFFKTRIHLHGSSLTWVLNKKDTSRIIQKCMFPFYRLHFSLTPQRGSMTSVMDTYTQRNTTTELKPQRNSFQLQEKSEQNVTVQKRPFTQQHWALQLFKNSGKNTHTLHTEVSMETWHYVRWSKSSPKQIIHLQSKIFINEGSSELRPENLVLQFTMKYKYIIFLKSHFFFHTIYTLLGTLKRENKKHFLK